MKFTRMFLPIGQGAFYLERIDAITVIYDCGICYQQKNDKRVERLIDSTLLKNEEIDILFISHFDYDHVSKIPYLIKKHKIKRVVLPLMHSKLITFITKVYKDMNENELSLLVENPQQLFGSETQIIRVAYSEENSNDERIDTVEIESLFTREISNNCRIIAGEWQFIPYNHGYDLRSYIINEELKNIDFNKLINDHDYFEKNQKHIKDIYKSLNGGINQNSMFLYSGPTEDIIRDYYHFTHSWCQAFPLFYGSKNIGCIYTGDGDLNVVDISTIYFNYISKVGTIQIPHHGDDGSFNIQSFTKGHYVCPICFGTDNHYGHPSPNVIDQLLNTGCFPIFITQNSSDMLITKN